MAITGKNLSLYFHVPFCSSICPYCHFYKIFYKPEMGIKYLQAVKNHIDRVKSILKNSNIVSIYFGGGTPSLLEVEIVEKILKLINPPQKIEITIEINPEDYSIDKIKAYKQLGINRVSLGIQSFDDRLLKILKRKHSAKKAKDAILDIYRCGIENISIDLMYDILHQDLASFKKTIDEIKNLKITHISLYNLTFEKETLFYKNRKTLKKFVPDEKESLKLLNEAVLEFEKLGFKRYEISAFAKKGFESFHNVGYWKARSFLGFGPSAFSYFENKRFRNIKNFQKYVDALALKKTYINFEEFLKYPDNINELLAINLRLVDGIDILEFEKEIGKIPKKTIKILKNSEFINFHKNRIKLNKKGLLFYDTLASDII
ncbi:MAG: Oxygen-independent coproporphyrinogen-III oxidase-like protein YqeR [Candidatus Anoxychlamydiales bacterium]|nr:Oxygen-independent coproporphyrinogen-III oxidase-like protein YqeR [Candidatus Anoxychlamydiales bacterium]NGX40953.1 Oxygen-independent coproporphyrinogen-III oxidase-like protein YqeR [Candidatus Anoxychlamydiales bacterium]HEU63943.1 radical SAM family heme chaperone HemW [Chlamydiota bacterium]